MYKTRHLYLISILKQAESVHKPKIKHFGYYSIFKTDHLPSPENHSA